jgi:hypothetical protein
MSCPPDCAFGVWQRKHVLCALKPAGIESATPRPSGLWQVAQLEAGRAPPRECFAWSNSMLKLRRRGNGLTAADGGSAWQTVQIGLDESANCCV